MGLVWECNDMMYQRMHCLYTESGNENHFNVLVCLLAINISSLYSKRQFPYVPLFVADEGGGWAAPLKQDRLPRAQACPAPETALPATAASPAPATHSKGKPQLGKRHVCPAQGQE